MEEEEEEDEKKKKKSCSQHEKEIKGPQKSGVEVKYLGVKP